jgi:hypothetical protein
MDRQGSEGPEGPGGFPPDPTEDRAAFDPSAAEQYEGAPAASAAPDDEDAPQDEAAEEPDYRALWESAQQETAQERQARQALEAQQQQLMFQASQQAWEKERQDAHAYAAQLDYEPAQKYLADFYAGREQRLMGWAQQATQAVWINQHAEQVMRHFGLDPEDRVRLGSDPNQMAAIAQSIAGERSRFDERLSRIERENKQLKRQIAAGQALGNPAYRQGGTRPGAPKPTDPNYAGSLAQLADLLSAPPTVVRR